MTSVEKKKIQLPILYPTVPTVLTRNGTIKCNYYYHNHISMIKYKNRRRGDCDTSPGGDVLCTYIGTVIHRHDSRARVTYAYAICRRRILYWVSRTRLPGSLKINSTLLLDPGTKKKYIFFDRT